MNGRVVVDDQDSVILLGIDVHDVELGSEASPGAGADLQRLTRSRMHEHGCFVGEEAARKRIRLAYPTRPRQIDFVIASIHSTESIDGAGDMPTG
jgi:hypothetical protein